VESKTEWMGSLTKKKPQLSESWTKTKKWVAKKITGA
jgi:hypothetical protein